MKRQMSCSCWLFWNRRLWTVGWKLCYLDNEIQGGPCWCLSHRAYPGLSASCTTKGERGRGRKGERAILVETLAFHIKHLWWILRAALSLRTFLTFLSRVSDNVCQNCLISQPHIVPSGTRHAPAAINNSSERMRCVCFVNRDSKNANLYLSIGKDVAEMCYAMPENMGAQVEPSVFQYPPFFTLMLSRHFRPRSFKEDLHMLWVKYSFLTCECDTSSWGSGSTALMVFECGWKKFTMFRILISAISVGNKSNYLLWHWTLRIGIF